MGEVNRTYSLPVLPLKNSVVFPFLAIPVSVGRAASLAAMEQAVASEDQTLVILAQKEPDVEEPQPEDLYPVGTRVVIKTVNKTDAGAHEYMVHGLERVQVLEFEKIEPHLQVRCRSLPMPMQGGTEVEALQRELMDLAGRYFSLSQAGAQIVFPPFMAEAEHPLHLVYLLGVLLSLDVPKSQALLEAPSVEDALQLMHRYLAHEVSVLEIRQNIAKKAESEMSREQRDYILRQQLQTIREELGEESPGEAEASELRRRFEEAELPEEIRKEVERELLRLEQMPPIAPDYQVTRTHLELILELPWRQSTRDILDLGHARQVLDEDHYGLKEIKQRILEHLAVLKLNPEAQAPILCFVGPPGVGKTSLGQSIARALGRKFERFSLGGMHDEAELRGHRRTYIGAMPGRIIQALRRAGVSNPLLMLDEVDKLGRDFRGDPAAALMEILDPAQNFAFRDNYLDLPFDLSRVLFITTANTVETVPGPLRDRMETIPLSGYSDEEKLEIARRYLLPRRREQAGLTGAQLTIPDETIMAVIRRYTREAGVRELERMLGRLARKAAVHFAQGRTEPIEVRPGDLAGLLGPERFFIEQARKKLPPGVATGLAWTETGGDVLYVEAITLPEGEKFTLTGQLGEVMKESAQAANSYVVSRSGLLDLPQPPRPVHIHVPAGAIPKDGPSAGVTIAAALASLYTGLPTRNDTAMTGEITLSGLVLPVGGIKEKLLAARRAGIKRVILPLDNEKDLQDLPEEVREEMEICFAERIEDIWVHAIPALSERLHAAA
ncbi:MAG: endopeptidase La [Desulfobacteraceae bacterium]|nr:endopeptidase La [Desulfobacteraceae bacterium]